VRKMDDYWEDYGEFNEEIESLRESLKTTVKGEIKKELESLRKENRELKGKVANLDKLEKEAKEIKRKADNEYETAVKRANYLKADELFKYLEETKYTVRHVSYTTSKCEKCNDDRNLLFTYPSGKEGVEKCPDCGFARYHWKVDVAIGTSIDIRNGELMIWYKPFSYKDDNYHSMSGDIKKLYKGEDFEAIKNNKYSILFGDEETAQKYADFLNEAEQQ
jgi:hypothetical protein